MSRLPEAPVDTPDPVVRVVFERFAAEGRQPIALYRILAGAPGLLAAYSGLSKALRDEAGLPRALRELVILRAAQLTGSDYEWAHHRQMALTAGLAEEKIRDLGKWDRSPRFDQRERAALTCVERVHEVELDEESFAAVRSQFGEEETIELLVICSFYEMVARLIQAFDVEVESPYEAHLSDAPGVS